MMLRRTLPFLITPRPPPPSTPRRMRRRMRRARVTTTAGTVFRVDGVPCPP
jgi:hypothetical protein